MKTDLMPSTNRGTHLIILLIGDLAFKRSLFQMVFRTKHVENFNWFYMIVSDIELSTGHENLLREMYSHHDVLNAVIVALDTVCSDLTVITHNPFENRTFRLPNNEHKREVLFPEKNLNLFGNPFNVIMYEDTVTALNRLEDLKTMDWNYDAFLPGFITLLMNATLILKTPYTESTDFIDLGKADLIVNTPNYPLRSLKALGLERTTTYRRDDICILVPYNTHHNDIHHLYRMLSPCVRLLMFVVMLLTWISFRWAQRGKMWNRPYLLDVLAFHMNQPLTKMPKTFALRSIVASCLIYCIVITSVFMGSLYISMSTHKYKEIATLDELLKTNRQELLVNPGFYKYAQVYLKNSPVNDHLKIIKFFEFIHRIKSNQIHYAYVLRNRATKYFENTQIVDREPAYYTMKECVVPLMTFYLVRVGSPFLDRINYFLRLAEESGIFHYNEMQISHTYQQLNPKHLHFIDQTAKRLEHFDYVFQIWCYGLILSSTIFVIEGFASRLKKWLIEKCSRG